ncbi:MAG: hypothetical protein JW874_13845 [Spirochaetales bacterium]|nr:hypothetical protein [Spirochaetales bacterium]
MEKRHLMLLLVICLITGFASAQESNTSQATQELFETEVDWFMSVTDFSEIASKNFYFIGLNSGYLEGGVAFKLGTIYLGVYYNGYVLYNGDDGDSNHQTETTVTTQQLFDEYYNVTGYVETTTVQATENVENRLYLDNDGSVLFGFGTMGLKLRAYQTGNTVTDAVTGLGTGSLLSNLGGYTWDSFGSGTLTTGGNTVSQVSEVQDLDGNVITRNTMEDSDSAIDNLDTGVGLEFGMNLDMGGMKLKPVLSVGGVFVNNSETQTRTDCQQDIGNGYDTYGGFAEATDYHQQQFQYGDNYLDLDAGLGLTFGIIDAEDKTLEFGLEYDFAMPLALGGTAYIDETGAEQTVAGPAASYVETTYSIDANGTTERVSRACQFNNYTAMSHSVNPGMKLTKALSDRAKFGFSANVPVTYATSSSQEEGSLISIETYDPVSGDPSEAYTDTTVKTHTGNLIETQEFSVVPEINAAVTFDLVPGRFSLNGGVKVTLPGFSSTVTTTTTNGIDTYTNTLEYEDGTVTTTYEDTLTGTTSYTSTVFQEADTLWSNASTSINFGFQFIIADGIMLDALSTISGTTMDLSSFRVQVTIKK